VNKRYIYKQNEEGNFVCDCGRKYKSERSYRDHCRKNKHMLVDGYDPDTEEPKTKTETRDFLKDNFGITTKELDKILVAKKGQKPRKLSINIVEEYKCSLIADTHLCSNYEQNDKLNLFYDMCLEEGIKDVYHAGDIVAGQGIFHGQEYEIHTFGADNQVKYVVENYPKRKGITTHFILGNHDYAYFKKMGIDIGKQISLLRDDMKYLGMFQADVFMGEQKLIRLVHPDGGMPYALTYRAQKLAEQIPSGEKPKILALGHLHTEYKFKYRNMNILGCGCFEGQSPFILRKGINPVIGGYIVTMKFADDENKTIVSFTPDFRDLTNVR